MLQRTYSGCAYLGDKFNAISLANVESAVARIRA